MKKLIVVILVMLTANLSTWAQDQMLQDTLQNVVVIKDARLDILVTRPEAIRLATEAASEEKPKIVENEVTVYNPIKAGKKTVTGSIIQKQGFRVMIYNGPDRVIAMKIKSEFNRNFPGMRSYMNYNVPNFKIKVGDFEDKKEAYKFLKRITPLLPTSSLVPDAVTVKNILVQ